MKTALFALPLAACLLGAAAPAQTIDTVVGTGSPGFGGDGGPARLASISPNLDLTANVAVDRNGDLYFTDTNNHRIRRVDARTGIATTVAGTGVPGELGDGGLAAEAQLSNPTDLVFDRQGRLVVADAGNNRLRRLDLAKGTIETIAGTGALGFSGDGGPAAAAAFEYPASIDLDARGNLFVADTWNARIRRIDAATGVVTTVAGAGCYTYNGDGPALSACFTLPTHLRVARDGAVVVAVNGDSRVVRIDPEAGTVTTIAGNGVSRFDGDGIPAAAARLSQPNGVAFDRAGNLYIADWQAHRIRKVDAATGVISTVAGNGRSPSNGIGTFSGDGGPATAAGLSAPTGVTIDARGNLLIVDALNARIRRVENVAPAPPPLPAPGIESVPVGWGD